MKFLYLASALLLIASQRVNGQEDRRIAEQRCRNTLCPVDAPPICATRYGGTETFTNSCFMYITNNCNLKPEKEWWIKLHDGECR